MAFLMKKPANYLLSEGCHSGWYAELIQMALTQYSLLERPSHLSSKNVQFEEFNVIKLRDYVLLPPSNLKANILIIIVRGSKNLHAPIFQKHFIKCHEKIVDLTCDAIDNLGILKEPNHFFKYLSGVILNYGRMEY